VKLVFLGAPGAGKGTQASRMASRFGLKHASTGQMFREAVRQGSEVGKAVAEYLDSGRLVPDQLTSRVVKELVLERFRDYILDGYPRTIPQAQALSAMLQERGEKLDAVIFFDVEQKVAMERLSGRLVCERCGANYHRLFMPPRRDGICDECGGRLVTRSDSTPGAVQSRLDEYHEKTRPLLPYYRERGILRVVDASGSPPEVARSTERILAELQEREQGD